MNMKSGARAAELLSCRAAGVLETGRCAAGFTRRNVFSRTQLSRVIRHEVGYRKGFVPNVVRIVQYSARYGNKHQAGGSEWTYANELMTRWQELESERVIRCKGDTEVMQIAGVWIRLDSSRGYIVIALTGQ